MRSKSQKEKQGVARLFELAGQRGRKLTLACVLSVLSSAARIVPFFTIYGVVRELLAHYQEPSMVDQDAILTLCAVTFGAALVYGLCAFVSSALSHTAAYEIIYDLRLQLMEKLSAGASNVIPGSQNILIDLSSWYRESLAPKVDCIRKSMDRHYTISFHYYAPKGESYRTIEPYYLIFRWSSWYVWGYCRDRKDYRLFKLNRMDELRQGEPFTARSVPLPDLGNERIFPGGIRVKALFEPECKWRLVEEFGTNCFEEREDGKLLFHAGYTDAENLLTWLLTFRDKAVLLEPEELREELIASVKKMERMYKEG